MPGEIPGHQNWSSSGYFEVRHSQQPPSTVNKVFSDGALSARLSGLESRADLGGSKAVRRLLTLSGPIPDKPVMDFPADHMVPQRVLEALRKGVPPSTAGLLHIGIKRPQPTPPFAKLSGPPRQTSLASLREQSSTSKRTTYWRPNSGVTRGILLAGGKTATDDKSTLV
jgi:hypothetical protein